MDLVVTIKSLQPVLFGGLAALAFVRWRDTKDRAAALLCSAFSVLAFFFIGEYWLPSTTVGSDWIQAVSIALLVFFPFLLYEFMGSFVPTRGRLRFAALTLTAILAVTSFSLTTSPDPADASMERLWLSVLLIMWVGLTTLVVIRLWRAGRGQPALARSRMRTMSLGAGGLAIAAVLEGELSESRAGAAVQLIVMTAGLAMAAGFSPPSVLRIWWRHAEDAQLRKAVRALMRSTTTEEVTAILLPQARSLVAAEGAVLETDSGEVIAIDGKVDELSREISGNQRESAEVVVQAGSARLRLSTGPFTPFFGVDEIELLETLADLSSFALKRNRLIEDQQRLATLVESSNDAIIAWSLDGTVLSWNQGAELVYGYTAEEMVGQALSRLIPEGYEDNVSSILNEVRTYGKTEHHETKRLTKNGNPIDVSLSASGIHDGAQNLVGVSVIARDVTASKRVREIAVEQAQMLDLVQTAVIGRDLSGAITYWNLAAEELYEWSKQEALEKHSHDLLRTRFPEPRDEIQSRLLSDGRWQGELRHSTKSGAEIVVTSRWVLRREVDGAPLQVLEAGDDITEQVRLEKDLQRAKEDADRANLAKSEFLSRMSHELRTPLNAILGFAQLLRKNTESETADDVQQILRAGRHLLSLVNEVLDLSRIESGQLSISLESVVVDDVVDECLALMSTLIADRSIIITNLLGDGHGSMVVADRQRLKQVLLNVLSNAVKYNREGGHISIRCTEEDGLVRLSVRDTGPGIAQEKIRDLYVPFARLGAETTEVEGSGLGLALSLRLMEMMDGRIGVDHTGPDGTQFCIELNAADEDALVSEEAISAASPRTTNLGLGKMATVLQVEDNPANIRLLERILSSRDDVELLTVQRGREAVKAAVASQPDLILLDVNLPDLSGKEILARLRAEPETSPIPVVMLSADASPRQIEEFLAAGAIAYVTKPIDIDHLMSVVDDVIGEGQTRL